MKGKKGRKMYARDADGEGDGADKKHERERENGL